MRDVRITLYLVESRDFRFLKADKRSADLTTEVLNGLSDILWEVTERRIKLDDLLWCKELDKMVTKKFIFHCARKISCEECEKASGSERSQRKILEALGITPLEIKIMRFS